MCSEKYDPIVSIHDLDKAALLCALYNNAKWHPWTTQEYKASNSLPITKDAAQKIIDENGEWMYYDWLQGKIIGANLGARRVNAEEYDHINGRDSLRRIVDELRQREKSEPLSR